MRYREIVAELVLLVGDDQDVVADPLGKAGDLGLYCEMTGIGPTRSGDKGPGLLLDHVGAEFLRAVTDVGREFGVTLAMADDQQQVRPALGGVTRYWTRASASMARLGSK